MDWKRTKFSRWKSGDFTITEIESIDRPYQLDVIDESPIAFPSLRQAQQVAGLKHELNLSRQENIELRAQMNARNGHNGSALTLVEATRQLARLNARSWENEPPEEEDAATQQQRLAADGLAEQGMTEHAAETTFALDDHGHHSIPAVIPSQELSLVDSAEVDTIAARLLEVMAKNSNGNGRAPRIFAEPTVGPHAKGLT
jgi:hypothetical protein